MQVTNVQSKVRKHTAIKVPLATIFILPTVLFLLILAELADGEHAGGGSLHLRGVPFGKVEPQTEDWRVGHKETNI